MDTLWHTVKVRGNLLKLLDARERHESNAKRLQAHMQFTSASLKRLDLECNLIGHQGCVNCLQWTQDGRYLASGSDDTNVRIWDPFANKCMKVIPTNHIGNIFSVKFVGDGSYIATASGDCRVIVRSMKDLDVAPIIDCKCHAQRVKRLATAPDEPSLFWSAGEDGVCLQYDLRESHECLKNTKVLVDLSYRAELKCICVNPTKPHLIAIGANDSYVRLYDRRFISTSKLKENHHTFDVHNRTHTASDTQHPNCVQYFAPGHLAKDNGGFQSYKLLSTYVTFDPNGNELLVNMGGEHIYLFNINNSRSINHVRVPECLSNTSLLRRRNSLALKSCCVLFDDEQYAKLMALQHIHNYTFNSNSPCACDYMDRAKRLFKREWIGDVYSAARDYLHVIQCCPDYKNAYYEFIRCLIHMNWTNEAECWLQYFKWKFKLEDMDLILLTKAVAATTQANAEAAAATAARSSGGDGNGGSATGGLGGYSSTTTTTTSSEDENVEVLVVSEEEKALRLNSNDYELRYIGHCNVTTDIKEANFIGERGDFICAGSDGGMMFIWDKHTTNLLSAFNADSSIVNCVQPHPTTAYIASSGIDRDVKIWAPTNRDHENYKNMYAVDDIWSALKSNQDHLSLNPFETILLNMGFSVRNTETTTTGYSSVGTCRTS